MTELGVACGPVEIRAAGYTGLILRGLHAAAEGDIGTDVDRLAVVESCRGLWRRALSACTVSPAGAVLTRHVRARLSDCLLSGDGAYVAALEVGQDGRMALLSASDTTVYGDSPDPRTWRYDLTIPTPNGGHVRRIVSRDGVLHVQWRVDDHQPWLSAGPWGSADSTSALAGRIERLLGREVNSPVGTVIPHPTSMSDDALDDLEAAVAALRGGVALTPTTAGGGGAGLHDAPRTDWRSHRIGPSPSREVVDLRARTCSDLAAAAGVPPALLRPDADATATREGLRAFAVAAVEPVIAQIAELASVLLETDVSITLPPGYLDTQARARAFRALAGRDGNITVDDARRVVGI